MMKKKGLYLSYECKIKQTVVKRYWNYVTLGLGTGPLPGSPHQPKLFSVEPFFSLCINQAENLLTILKCCNFNLVLEKDSSNGIGRAKRDNNNNNKRKTTLYIPIRSCRVNLYRINTRQMQTLVYMVGFINSDFC